MRNTNLFYQALYADIGLHSMLKTTVNYDINSLTLLGVSATAKEKFEATCWNLVKDHLKRDPRHGV